MEAFISYLKFTLGVLLGFIIVSVCFAPFIATILLCFVSGWFSFLFIVTLPLALTLIHIVDNSTIADKLFDYLDDID